MGIMGFMRRIFGKIETVKKAPFVMISKDTEVIEYECIEVAIAELEKDPDIPKNKLEKIRASFEVLKKKGRIRIKNGEVID